jgi:hypothetical protein
VSADSPEPIAFVARPAQVEQPPAVLEHANQVNAHVTRAATPEEMNAIAALFAQRAREQEGGGVASLIGAYSAGMLLHDLMKDMFTSETREVEVEEEKPRKKDRED